MQALSIAIFFYLSAGLSSAQNVNLTVNTDTVLHSIDPKIYDALVGRYQAAPTFVLTVTREGDHLFVQATGQPRFEIFPEGPREYFLKVVEAQIAFDARPAALS